MKLYSLCTPSHRVLVDDWFLPSLCDDYDVILETDEQMCPTGEYQKDGWLATMIRKVELIIKATRENQGEVFVYSDVDIQFFSPMAKIIDGLFADFDLLVQRDDPAGRLCAGFFAMQANAKTLQLWTDIRSRLITAQKDDQIWLNSLLLFRGSIVRQAWFALREHASRLRRIGQRRLVAGHSDLSNPYGIRWRHLPPEFFGGGMYTGKNWQPGMALEFPRNIVLHHANWTCGIDAKIAQLQYVRARMEARQ